MFFKKSKVVPINFPQFKNTFKEKNCIICFSDFKEKNGIDLPCGHCFHSDCLLSWFDKDMSCPICRKRYMYKLVKRKKTY